MNKCAKFRKDNPSDKKVKFNLPSAIELSETAVFVYNLVPSFVKIIQAIKKLNSISRARLNFRRRPFLCTTWVETLCKRATSVAHLTNFSFEFVYEIFTEDASLLLLFRSAKKSKMTKNSNQGGSCLNNNTHELSDLARSDWHFAQTLFRTVTLILTHVWVLTLLFCSMP